jgi:hypothetical protein
MTPVRLTLSRRRGFRLQERSRAVNGLICVSVARPGRWGNPFKGEDAVERFRCEAAPLLEADARRELRGKNLACWCKLCAPCHADVLLEIANATGTAEIRESALLLEQMRRKP